MVGKRLIIIPFQAVARRRANVTVDGVPCVNVSRIINERAGAEPFCGFGVTIKYSTLPIMSVFVSGFKTCKR